MEGFLIKKNLIYSQGQLFSNYITTFSIDQNNPKQLLPYQILTNKGYQDYLFGSAEMLESFKQALKLEENYYTVMNLCVIYLAQRNLKKLDELQNKACNLANGQTHHIVFMAELNLIIHDYDKAIIQLVEILNDPEQNEIVMVLLQQIFNNKLYSKQYLQKLIKDDNILQKLVLINKKIFTKEGQLKFDSKNSNQSQNNKNSLNLTQLTNCEDETDAPNQDSLNLKYLSSQILNSLSKQSSQFQEQTISQATEKTEQLSLITDSQDIMNLIAQTSSGSSIDFTFIDIVIDNPKLFSFQFRIPYMIGSYDIREMNKLEQKIAEGGFGAVYVSKNLINNEIHAVKVIKEQEDQNVNLILQEIIIQDQIQQLNPNLFINLKPLIYLKKKNKLVDIYIPLELAQFSLYDYIKEIQVEQEEYIQFYNIFIDFIVTLHENNFAHRDIKPQNILFVKDVGWKLADFGESIKYKQVEDLYKIRGTFAFLPQKIRKLQKIQHQTKQNLLYNDVYAIVCTLILIQNPNLNSKGLTDFMDNNQFDQKQTQLLENFHDLEKLRQLKVNQARSVQTNIIIKKQIQEQHSSWDCLERFQFCVDQQIPLEDDLIIQLDGILGLFQQKQQFNQLVLYSLIISNSFPFQLDKFKNILYFNFNRHKLGLTVITENYCYYRQIIRYLTIIKLYNTSIYICDQIMKIEYEVDAHLFKIEALRLSDRINEAKQELELAYRYLLQVQSYTLDEQILFVELYQKLHNEVPQIKVDKYLETHMKKINNKNTVQSRFHDIDDGFLVPINSHQVNEKQYLQIRLDVILKSIYYVPEKLQPSLYQYIIVQFGTEFLIDGKLSNVRQLVENIKENLIFWNTIYHQKIHVIAVGINQIFQYYGEYHIAFQLGAYFHKILLNLGSWNSIFCQFEQFLDTQIMLFDTYNKPLQYSLDLDACIQEVQHLPSFDNVYLRLRINNYIYTILNNFDFTYKNRILIQGLQQDFHAFMMEGINIVKMYLRTEDVTEKQQNILKSYLEKMLMTILNTPCEDKIGPLRLIKKIYNFQFHQNQNNTHLKNYSIPYLDIGRQHKIVQQLFKQILMNQEQINQNSFRQHKFYYKTLSKLHILQTKKFLKRQEMLGSQFKQSLLASLEDKFNIDIKYFLCSHQQFRLSRVAQKMEQKIDQINLFQQFINF